MYLDPSAYTYTETWTQNLFKYAKSVEDKNGKMTINFIHVKPIKSENILHKRPNLFYCFLISLGLLIIGF